jgi:hypothetical protein
MRWAGLVAQMQEKRVWGFGWETEGKKHLEHLGMDGMIILK